MPSQMLSVLVLAVLCVSCVNCKSKLGRIIAIRVWENSHGIQLRYEHTWSTMIGRVVGSAKELTLFDNEVIVQISGKHDKAYIYQVIFVTCLGRSLFAGQPHRDSFNFYPIHVDAELRLLSGRFNGNGITSLAAHWGVVYMDKGKRFFKNPHQSKH